MRATLCLGVLLVAVAGVGRVAVARSRGRDPAKENQYAAALEKVDPAVAALFHQGTAALDAGRPADARAAFEKVLARVPDHAPTLRRLSYALGATGDVSRAIEVARRARAALPSRDGDYALASALAADGTADHLAEAGELAEGLVADEPEEPEAALAAMIFARQKKLLELGKAVAALERLAPDGVPANYMGAIYYAARDELGKASAAIDRAEAAGLPTAEAERFRRETGVGRHRAVLRAVTVGLWVIGAWVVGLLLIFVVGRLLSAAALRAIERHAADRGDGLLDATRSLRRIYAVAIGIAAVYYYLSIPIVIALVGSLVALAFYGVFLLGRVPIKLMALLLFGGCLTIWALVRSVFARRGKDKDPGRRLPEEEAPALWQVLREVAGEVGTRPVDDVFLTPGTEVAVAERGSMAERLRDRGRRFLILGVGVLDGLSVRPLRAVLAHEYGHFSNRDTAGGDAAARVRASLLAAVIRIAQGGGAGVLNPAWHFLRIFYALFQRITLGASRLQEVMADRFAAVAYGGAVFAEGLRHVVRRDIQFAAEANVAIREAESQRRAIANLYTRPQPGSLDGASLEEAIQKTMTDAGSSPYDSHPPVERRIAWVAAFETPAGAPAAVPAWTLFPDRARLEAEMTRLINQRLDEQGAIDLHPPPPWRAPGPGAPPPPATPSPA